ncbi:SGNH/GDSL hydrolase family protein [Robbsia sp. Bb-Pol-6]|uniref:SGNH/GDSL hydrolase family protein n=1 Tax=Robbsia betulipollinis TaxID=2981849 RepID=A0ABT3ZTH7_9BURK|nr:SGNH/GDSL hydrolase family protein [Robbsia betulipollinis]MCY0389856.1 SGNH/GDSL hydrolase family protein [Robbsia betulipollinis]
MTRPQPGAFYVALGSSFAAGLGLGPRAPNSPIVSQRSQNGYPQQLARLLKVPSFTDMTSSGATLRQVLKGGQFHLGPQVDALGPDTRLVTLTAGGNDVKYIGDLVALAYRNRGGVIGFLVKRFWKGPKPIDERGFPALRNDFDATLAEIARRSPKAQVVVATYPTVLPVDAGCPRLGLTGDQANMMRPVSDALAETTRAAAGAAGAMLVDMATLSVGHDVCSAVPWVNGPYPDKRAGTAFHPTLVGARATADAIRERLRAHEGQWFVEAFTSQR